VVICNRGRHHVALSMKKAVAHSRVLSLIVAIAPISH